MKSEIIRQIEEILNGRNNYLKIEELSLYNSLEEYEISVAKRLIITWVNYKKGLASKVDFEAALRDYLLVFTTQIKINNYSPSEKFENFGLFMNEESFEISANYRLPSFTNSKLIQKGFMAGTPHTEGIDPTPDLLTNGFIQNLTGFSSFKSEEQKICVMGSLNTPDGHTALVSMSTGGGKSLITQTISYQKPNSLTVVVVPTISLMIDQARNANEIIKPKNPDEIVYYNSSEDINRILFLLSKKTIRLLFVSPEALIKNSRLQKSLIDLCVEGFFQNFIVDEAHIIIEWGTSFRVDFQCLDALRKAFIEKNPKLRTFLLSATFSRRAVEQLKSSYAEQDNWVEIRCDRLRREPIFDIIKVKSREKKKSVIDAIYKLPHPMIVYVNSPDDADKLLKDLFAEGFKNVHTFTGKTTDKAREKLIKQWVDNQFNIMIATCAFGVGVDKKDVRTVLHTYVPDNPNRYYQEAGRGGRDGLPCLSVLIYTDDDVESAFSMLQKVLTLEKLYGRWFTMLNSPKCIKKGGGIVILDTSVIPKYNDSEKEIKFFTGQDVSWNVYVILLLRRGNLLELINVSFENNKYIFTVKADSRILHEGDASKDVLSSVRETEWEEIEQEFRLMNKALKNVGKECWSEMFNDIYNLTEAYCAGCNNHILAIDESVNEKVLKKKINKICSKSDDLTNLFSSSNYLLIPDGNSDLLNLFAKHGVNSIVANEYVLSSVKDYSNTTLNLLSFKEFLDFSKSSLLFTTGVTAVFLPAENDLTVSVLFAASSIVKTTNSFFIFISKEDYIISNYNKKLSEIIAGPCKKSYIIEELL